MKPRVFIDQSKRKSGKSYWCVETNLGKRIRKYFPTREKAYANAGEIKQSYMSGLEDDSPVEAIKVSTILRLHLDELSKRGARYHTIESRTTKCVSFIKRMDDPCLSNISRQIFKDYILQYGQTESTRKSIRSEVGALLNWAFENEYTSTNYYKVTWAKKFKDEKLIGILTSEESKELMDNIADRFNCTI